MEAPFRSAGDLRHNICNELADLGQYGTQKLPNGATVYVVGNDSLYRLVKGVGNTYDDLTSLVINPDDGSDNRWFRQTENGADPWGVQIVLGANLAVTPNAQNAWIALGSTAGQFARVDGSAWTLNDSTGLALYKGPTRLVQATYQITLIGAAAIDVEAALNVDGTVPQGSTAPAPTYGNQAGSVTTTTRACLSGQATYLISTNSTIRLMLRNLTGTQQITALYATYSVFS